MNKTLYQAIVEVCQDVSDLYFPVNKETEKIVAQYSQCYIKKFFNQNTNTEYFEAPFCYDPYWISRLNK